MCVAGEKSKLIITGTKELKRTKLRNTDRKIMIGGNEVKESRSEKLLGIIVNNIMTWQDHLYGEKWRVDN